MSPSHTKKCFSINEIGCGYGALYKFLKDSKYKFKCIGYDISQEMLSVASEYTNNEAVLINSDKITHKAEYSVTSGIFNAKFHYGDQEWLEYILKVLHNMNEMSSKGFSFNMLTNFVDYRDPNYFFDYARKNFSRRVVLLHDYNLWEWTILVRK